jgi:hypothetical protein
MKAAERKALSASIRELYLILIDAIVGYRKDVTVSTLSILLAEICMLGSDEERALHDIDMVANVAKDHAKVLALRDVPTAGRMN